MDCDVEDYVINEEENEPINLVKTSSTDERDVSKETLIEANSKDEYEEKNEDEMQLDEI